MLLNVEFDMKILILACSPNKDGLTAACAKRAEQVIKDGKGKAITVWLNDLKISKCQACKNGWGTCHNKGSCQLNDDFQNLQKQIHESDGVRYRHAGLLVGYERICQDAI